MKYRWIFVLAVLAALALSVLASGMEPERNRVHQHLEAAEKLPCTDHDASVFCTHLPLMEITTDGPVPAPFLQKGEAISGNIWAVAARNRNYEMVAATGEHPPRRPAGHRGAGHVPHPGRFLPEFRQEELPFEI